MTKRAYIADDAAAKALTILQLLLRDYHPRDFTICFWDGSQWPSETNASRFKLTFKHPDALRSILWNSTTDLSISEAYIRDNLDVEGDFEAAMPVGYHLLSRRWPVSTVLRLGWHLFCMPAAGHFLRNGRQPARLHGELHSIERDRQAVTYHYNVSKNF
jgi:cyclopropane-fatty-acyl-phospholipid synthase